MVDRAIEDERRTKLIQTLRAARKQLGLSQAALAAKLGKRQQFVSKYESGERRLDFFEVLDVADAVGLRTKTLLEDFFRDGAKTDGVPSSQD